MAASVTVGGAPLRPAARYSLATKAYLAEGRDGYTSLLGGRVLVSRDCAPMLPTVLANHFTKLAVLNAWVGGAGLGGFRVGAGGAGDLAFA